MDTIEIPASVEATRWVAAGALVALIVLSLAWELKLAPTSVPVFMAALKALPLCLPLAGLLKRRMYTYRWTSLLVWLYALDAGVRLRDGGTTTVLAVAELCLVLILFTACVFHVRLRLAK